jgi:oligopeptide/dipeptide ABC transporter ATP-binding protein
LKRYRLVEGVVKGAIPTLNVNVPSGFRFHPRCPYAKDDCGRIDPELRRLGEDHYVACHYAEEIARR